MAVLTHDFFQALVGEIVDVTADGKTIQLKINEVRLMPAPKKRTITGEIVEDVRKRAPFSVFFRSEGALGLVQGTYEMHRNGTAPLQIFIVPLGVVDGGVIYEAVFN